MLPGIPKRPTALDNNDYLLLQSIYSITEFYKTVVMSANGVNVSDNFSHLLPEVNNSLKKFFDKHNLELQQALISKNQEEVINIIVKIQGFFDAMTVCTMYIKNGPFCQGNINNILSIEEMLYKAIKQSRDHIEFLETNASTKEKLINLINASYFDIVSYIASTCYDRGEHTKAIAYLHKAYELTYALRYQSSEKILADKLTVHLLLAENQTKQLDLYSAGKSLQEVKKIYEKLKDKAEAELAVLVADKYPTVCRALAQAHSKNEDFLQAIFWFRESLLYSPNDGKSKITEVLIDRQKSCHKDLISNFIKTKISAGYVLSLRDNMLIIESVANDFTLSRHQFFEKLHPLQPIKTQLQIDVFSVSLTQLEINLKKIDKAYQNHQMAMSSIKHSQEKSEVSLLASLDNMALNSESHGQLSKLEDESQYRKPSKEEMSAAEEAQNNNQRLTSDNVTQEEPREIKKKSKKGKKQANQTNNSNKAKGEGLAQSLGFKSEFWNRKIYPLSHPFMPRTYGLWSPDPNDKIDPSVLDQHRGFLVKGEIGKSIKVTKNEKFPLKTWNPAHSQGGKFRMWGEVVDTVTDPETGETIRLIDFKHARDHKTQDVMYQKK